MRVSEGGENRIGEGHQRYCPGAQLRQQGGAAGYGAQPGGNEDGLQLGTAAEGLLHYLDSLGEIGPLSPPGGGIL
jgi:hypothetical protein